MAAKHASALESELRALYDQLAELGLSSGAHGNAAEYHLSISDPAQFVRTASRLSQKMQDLNRSVGKVFAADPSQREHLNPESAIAAILNSMPLGQTHQLTEFATRLAGSPARASDHAGSPHRIRSNP